MNRILIALLFVVATVAAHAQTKTASEKAQAEACDCFKKIDTNKVKTPEQKKEATTQCLVEAMTQNIVGLADENGYSISEIDEEVGRKIGEKFGMQLAVSCPEFIPYAMSMADESSPEDTKGAMDRMRGFDVTGTSAGTFVRLDLSGDTPKLILKNTASEQETLYWIRRFPGSDRLETDAKQLVGKKIEVMWGELEKYNPQLRGYSKLREITQLKVLN
jgi:hypothetical protein